MKCVGIVSNISNTRKSVSYDFQTSRSAPRFFSQLSKVFRNRIKHFFVCFMYLLTPLIVYEDIQSNRSPNFRIISITFPNPLHCSDFISFLYELLMSLKRRNSMLISVNQTADIYKFLQLTSFFVPFAYVLMDQLVF